MASQLCMKTVKWLSGNRAYNAVFLGVAGLLALWTCAVMVLSLYHSAWTHYVDFLYNYAGGFVRRGLTGEILFFVKDVTGIPPLVTCYAVSVVAYVAVAWFTIAKFRKQGYALNVLIMGFMLGGVLMTYLSDVRRDYIEMALFVVIIASFRRFPTGVWIALGNLVAIFAILLHEATFFFMVPVCVLVANIRLRNILKSVILWLPSVAAFMLCSYYKGTPETLSAICVQIGEYAPEALEDGNTPYLLSFISRDTLSVFKLHIMYNFTQSFSRYLPIPAVVFTLFYLLYMPFMTVCMIKVFSSKGLSASRQRSLVALILFQFVMLLPMFTLLSCDICRVGMYWLMSSVVVWLVLGDEEIRDMFPDRLLAFAEKVSCRSFDRRLPGKLALTLCVLFIGVTAYSRTATGVLYCSPVAKLCFSAKTVIEAIAR